jgi:hypothetical protein
MTKNPDQKLRIENLRSYFDEGNNNFVVEIAKAVLKEKPVRSYVESAFLLAEYVVWVHEKLEKLVADAIKQT